MGELKADVDGTYPIAGKVICTNFSKNFLKRCQPGWHELFLEFFSKFSLRNEY